MNPAKQKNILFLTHVNTLGGTGGYLLMILRNLSDEYHGHLMCQEKVGILPVAESLGASTKVIKMRGWRKWKYSLHNRLTIKKIRDYCVKHKIDLIYSNFYRVTPYAVSVARELNIPCITAVHDHAPADKLQKFETFESDLLVAVSQSVYNHLREHFKGPLVCIYNSIDVDAYRALATHVEDIRKEFAIGPKTKMVVVIAAIHPLKGYHVFFDAMKTVTQKIPDIKFVCVGKPQDSKLLTIDQLKQYVEDLGIAERVIFTGRREDVPSILMACDVLVHPSFTEAFGRVLIEAMCMGKAVVATHCGGPSEIVEDGVTGLLVEKENAEQLAEATIKILSNDERRVKMGQAGENRVKKMFSPEETVVQFNDLFADLLDEQGRNKVKKAYAHSH